MNISNGKVILTESNGIFVPFINETSNNWYKQAKPLFGLKI